MIPTPPRLFWFGKCSRESVGYGHYRILGPQLHHAYSIDSWSPRHIPPTLLISAMYLFAFHAFLQIGEIAVSSEVIQFSQVRLADTLCITFRQYKHYCGRPVTLSFPSHTGLFCPVTAAVLQREKAGSLIFIPWWLPGLKAILSREPS